MDTVTSTPPSASITKSPRSTVISGILALLLTIPLLFVGGSRANAAVIAVSYGYGTAYSNDYSDIYQGSLRDTTTPDGFCVMMQRKTSTGTWVAATGFWSGWTNPSGTEKTILACTTTFQDWHTTNRGNVYGLRLTRSDGGPSTTFCTSKSECLAMT